MRLKIYLILILLISGCSSNTPPQISPIKIALDPWVGSAHAFIAKELGYFKKNNVEVELVLTRNMGESREIFLNEEVDGLFDVFTDVINLNAIRKHAQVVFITDYSTSVDVIIGRSDFDFIGQRKTGKTISFDGVNSFSHLFVLKALEKSGVDERDFHFLNIPAADVLTALENGKIDAGHTWEPETSRALKKGYKIIFESGELPGLISDVLAFDSKIIRTRPNDIKAIIKSLLQAKKYIFSNNEKALRIMSKATNMTVEEMKLGLEGIHPLNLMENIEAMKNSSSPESLYGSGKIIGDFLLQRGQLTRLPDFDAIINPAVINDLGKVAQ